MPFKEMTLEEKKKIKMPKLSISVFEVLVNIAINHKKEKIDTVTKIGKGLYFKYEAETDKLVFLTMQRG